MRILNIIHAQSIGGVSQVFRDYNEALLKNGNEVAIAISNNGNDDYFLPGLKKIYKLENISPVFDIIHLVKIIYSFRPDIIICHSLRTMSWIKILRLFTSAKTVAINHGITFKKSLNCDYVFSINQQIADLVVKNGKEKDRSIFIPNMIKIDRNFVEKNFHNPPVIAMFGRIEPRKGFDVLIKAAAILKSKNINFRLKIGGFSVNNYNEDSLQNLIKENNLQDIYEFIGTVKNKKEFFKNIDIFCVPSREEPFGLVIIESLVNSTPVISSNSDGAKMILKNKKDGLIFEIDNIKDLAEKIEFLIKNQQYATSLAKEGFNKVKEKYSLQTVSKILQTQLEKIAKK
jgi:glycosyltransferase involved in cell wall biosynthesis